jgi:two-component system, OmpR family, phosphate regulon sensor histidine kinase PhoR
MMKNTKILIVDDEADIGLILKLQLEDAGYSTMQTRDGLSALDLLNREDFSLVLLDIKMPGMDGIKVLEKLHKSHPDMAVIMMTAHGSEDIAVETMKKGALDYITKPFATDDLLKKVERTLKLNKARQENIRLQQQLDEERKKMEAILQGMADLLIVVDKKGLISSLNRKAEILLGVRSDSCVGKPVESLIRADIPPERLPCKIVLQTLAPCLDVTFQLSLENGTIPVLSSATPLLNGKGELLGSVEIIRDISVLKALEQEKEDFVSMLTHDLKSPLTAVVGATDLVREGRLGNINEEQKEYLESAIESCAEMVEMIDTLLDVYKFEAGKMIMAFTREDLQPLIQRAITGFRSVAQRSNTKLTATFKENLPELMVDRNKISRVFSNIFSNAFKFTPDGGSIELSAECLDSTEAARIIPQQLYPQQKLPESGRFVKVTISDNGIGIPQEALATIFDRFIQAQSRRKGVNQGTGLGLAFCRKVTDAHGGFIWAESVLEKGSTFTILLPVQEIAGS